MEEILRNKNLTYMIKYLFLITDKVQAAKTINNDNKFGFFFILRNASNQWMLKGYLY